jgi:hypothetical protein
MHLLGHIVTLRMLIIAVCTIVALGCGLTAVLYLTLHERGQHRLPRNLRPLPDEPYHEVCGIGVSQHVHDATGFHCPVPAGRPPAGLSDTSERIWLPRTTPAPAARTVTVWQPRIRRELVPDSDRIAAFYIVADRPAARQLLEAGWRTS